MALLQFPVRVYCRCSISLKFSQADIHEQKVTEPDSFRNVKDAGYWSIYTRTYTPFHSLRVFFHTPLIPLRFRPYLSCRINPNYKDMVYCNGITYGASAEWNHAWKHYTHTAYASEVSNMIVSLACTKEVWTLNK